ncbi:MAG: serpin family protein [Planctomycetaceae bacterium]|nr:serpin family protein [Planctomycetaceae bacterium]
MKSTKIAVLLFLALVAVAIVVVLFRNRGNQDNTNRPGIMPMPLPAKTFHKSPEDYNRFAVESYLKIVRSKGDENAVFSPFSLSMALEILYAGSQGKTPQTLETLLHLPHLPSDQTGLPQNPALFEDKQPKRVLIDPWPYYTHPPFFLVGNSIWYSDKLTLNPDFAKNMKAAFFLETFPVDAAADRPQVARDMEQWTNRVTQGLIPSINPTPPVEASFTLLSTLYFKAFWHYQFQTINTRDAPFTLANGEMITVSTMKDESGFPFMQNEEFKALEMPYIYEGNEDFSERVPKDTRIKSDFSMLFILPRAVDGISALEEKLSEEFLQEIVGSLNPANLEVSIPKFRLEQENDLRTIFNDDSLVWNADYSGMFTPNPVTDDISAKQKIVLGIDEHGTEAAVATEIGYVSLGSDPPTFIADYPFLFLIRERKSGTILFLGRVMNPNEK